MSDEFKMVTRTVHERLHKQIQARIVRDRTAKCTSARDRVRDAELAVRDAELVEAELCAEIELAQVRANRLEIARTRAASATDDVRRVLDGAVSALADREHELAEYIDATTPKDEAVIQ